jgi:signal transduction histidine kinase
MLEHSRGTPGEREALDVNELLEEYVNLSYHGMRAQIVDFNATIARSYDETAGQVVLVAQEMGRVFINLLNNAFYAVYERAKKENGQFAPTVSVTTRRTGDRVEIEVSDNGSGVPEAMREKIFEPFFTTKPTGSGTGLGLSLSYDIVTKGHGGTLAIESEPEQGATFVISLPAKAL